MATAVLELFPGTKVSIGPPIEDGFYYDFEFPDGQRPAEADLERIGRGKVLEEGKTRPLDVKKGDHILVGKYAGTEIRIEDEELLILREDEVLATLADVLGVGIAALFGASPSADGASDQVVTRGLQRPELKLWRTGVSKQLLSPASADNKLNSSFCKSMRTPCTVATCLTG